MSSKILFVVVLLAAWAQLPVMASPASEAGTCQIACDRAEASCQQKLGRSGKCPYKRQMCNEKCAAPAAPLRSGRQQRLALCSQRCDLNRHTCEESNRGNERMCVGGQASCLKRCR